MWTLWHIRTSLESRVLLTPVPGILRWHSRLLVQSLLNLQVSCLDSRQYTDRTSVGA